MSDKYYKHIDGLRALAVVSVIVFHLDLPWVKSGFLGVDIFFVISGFLITSILLRDLDDETFSFKRFYLRRIRRILPVLIVVLIVTTFLAWLILLPEDLKNYTKSLISTILTIPNLFFFKFLDFGYFSTDSSVLPLLHMWSLGIEEQFYFFWPVFLFYIFLLRFSNKKETDRSQKIKLGVFCFILMIFSIFCFFWKGGPKYYYFPVTRAFELLLGCFLAIFVFNIEQNNEGFSKFKKTYFNIIALLSVVLMLYPIFFENVSYPSVWMIIVCLGAVLFIYTGLNSNYRTVVHRIFSLKPIVAIGLISYSLYLWHWPFIAFINYLGIQKTVAVNVLIVIVTFLFSIVTYVTIEKPFRYKFKFGFLKSLVVFFVVPLALIFTFASGVYKINKFGFNQILYINPKTYETTNIVVLCKYNKEVHNFSCPENIKDVDVIVFGDSHARKSIFMVSNWLKDLNLTAISIGENKGQMKDIYQNNPEIIKKMIYRYNPQMILFVGFWEEYTRDQRHDVFLAEIENNIKISIKNNVKPILMLDYPALYGTNAECGLTTLSKRVDKCSHKLIDILYDQRKSLAFIRMLKNKYPELELININKIICSKGYCLTSIRNTSIYSEGHYLKEKNLYAAHLSRYGSDIIGKLYMERYGNPLASKVVR